MVFKGHLDDALDLEPFLHLRVCFVPFLYCCGQFLYCNTDAAAAMCDRGMYAEAAANLDIGTNHEAGRLTPWLLQLFTELSTRALSGAARTRAAVG